MFRIDNVHVSHIMNSMPYRRIHCHEEYARSHTWITYEELKCERQPLTDKKLEK